MPNERERARGGRAGRERQRVRVRVRCVLVQEVVTKEVPFRVMCHSVCVTGGCPFSPTNVHLALMAAPLFELMDAAGRDSV